MVKVALTYPEIYARAVALLVEFLKSRLIRPPNVRLRRPVYLWTYQSSCLRHLTTSLFYLLTCLSAPSSPAPQYSSSSTRAEDYPHKIPKLLKRPTLPLYNIPTSRRPFFRYNVFLFFLCCYLPISVASRQTFSINLWLTLLFTFYSGRWYSWHVF